MSVEMFATAEFSEMASSFVDAAQNMVRGEFSEMAQGFAEKLEMADIAIANGIESAEATLESIGSGLTSWVDTVSKGTSKGGLGV